MAVSTYPVRVEATLDPHVSRWLWLVKWILAIPHYVVLAFLWVAFVVVSVVAFFAIAFTGRYPSSLFEFNKGVLRWSWRVHYYTFGALATDQYPPFTLGEVPEYPAHLDIAYPERLSKGLVWIKWWLLAIPHYLVVAIFIGGGSWTASQFHNENFNWAPGGLLGLLVMIAAVVLLFTGRYPRQIFDLILGLNRWVLRVAAYAGLMTDVYPPFRLDMGGHEPGGTLTFSSPSAAPTVEVEPASQPPAGGISRRGWTGGRIAALVIGSVLTLLSLGALAGGGVATWADNTQRDSDGYLTSQTHSFSTPSYALTSGKVDLGSSADAVTLSDMLGTVRIRVTPANAQSAIFLGIGPQSAVNAYLAGVSRQEITNWASGTTSYKYHSGAAPAASPDSVKVWTVQTSGPGTRTLTWDPRPGSWTAVVMNVNGAPGLSVTADIGATVPDLGWIGIGLLLGGAALLMIGAVLVIVPIIRASR